MTAVLIVEPAPRCGSHNMAIDAALLERGAVCGDVTLRLYRWSPPSLSFGRNEPAVRRYDRKRIEALGLAAVRRPTGGRAVWHDREVTYAIAGPARAFGSLRETYLAIHKVLAEALRRMGAPATLAPRQPALSPGAGACFASPVGGEVVAHGRKLVGSAQVRERGAFLQHGSILLEDCQDVVAKVTVGEAPAARAIALNQLLARPVGFDEVASAIVATAQKTWEYSWTQGPPPRVSSGVFADPDWTWRR